MSPRTRSHRVSETVGRNCLCAVSLGAKDFSEGDRGNTELKSWKHGVMLLVEGYSSLNLGTEH